MNYQDFDLKGLSQGLAALEPFPPECIIRLPLLLCRSSIKVKLFHQMQTLPLAIEVGFFVPVKGTFQRGNCLSAGSCFTLIFSSLRAVASKLMRFMSFQILQFILVIS